MKFPDSLIKYIETFDDDDLPDGAWQCMIEDSVEMYNEANNTKYNPTDVFIYYCMLKQNNEKT